MKWGIQDDAWLVAWDDTGEEETGVVLAHKALIALPWAILRVPTK